MYDFPASVRSETDCTTIITHFCHLALLAALVWLVIRTPRSHFARNLHIWLSLSFIILVGQFLQISCYVTKPSVAISSGIIAVFICMIGAIRVTLQSQRVSESKPELSILEIAVVVLIQIVRFVSADTDPKILKALLTVDGNEEVNEF